MFGNKIQTATKICSLLMLLVLGISLYFYYTFDASPRIGVKAKNIYTQTLHVVTDINYEPFSYLDDNGEYTGLDVELMNEIANRLHMNLDLKLMDWPAANSYFQSGQAQIIMNMETDLVVKNSDIIATIPTAEKQYVVYGREKISSVAELYGHKIASLHALPELGLEQNITYIDSYQKIFEGLKQGLYDFAVCPIQVGNFYLKKLHITDVQASYAVSHIYGALALASNQVALKERINVILKDLWQSGWMKYLEEKWIRNYYVNINIIELLEHHPSVVIFLLIVFLSICLILIYTYFQREKVKMQEVHMHDIQENLDTIQRQNEQLAQAQVLSEQRTMEISNALINILGVRDANLNGHSKHVQNLTLLLYDHLPEAKQRQINRTNLSYAALFHDVGKMGIPESILNKPSKLDDNEWAIMKKHPKIATTILDTVSSFKDIEEWIMYHHERIDGKGYYGIPGDKIPYESKIIAVADTYSAITMRRSYKDPKSNEEAMSILQKVKGTQLDAELVDIFCKIPLQEIMQCAPADLDVIRELSSNP